MSKLKYLVVMNFEATCWPEMTDIRPELRTVEIIEFPAVLLDIKTGQIVSEFHALVRPTEKPELSDYCKNLTGITQDQVDKAATLPVVMEQFDAWLMAKLSERNVELPRAYEACPNAQCALASWTNNDFQFFLGGECLRKGIPKPDYFNVWLDIKIKFKTKFPSFKGSFSKALEVFSIATHRREHSAGLHDSRNTAKLANALARKGVMFPGNDLMNAAKSDAWYFANIIKRRPRPK